jgi:hypothetical protein
VPSAPQRQLPTSILQTRAGQPCAAPPDAGQHQHQQQRLQPSRDGCTPEDDVDDFVLLPLSCYSTLEAELRRYKRNILGPGSCITQEAMRVFRRVRLVGLSICTRLVGCQPLCALKDELDG